MGRKPLVHKADGIYNAHEMKFLTAKCHKPSIPLLPELCSRLWLHVTCKKCLKLRD